MTYQETTDFLFNLQSSGIKLGLERMLIILDALGNPQKKFQSIHIAGTNGKGSTSALLEAILRDAGKRTGLYTSPHLVNVEERIKINGAMIVRDDFVKCVEILRPHIVHFKTTFFESLTALAFYYFALHNVEIAILEVGLGGRLDATNVVKPLQTLITSISHDHQHILGESLEEIAGEKCGILKPKVPCLTNNEQTAVLEVLKQKCEAIPCELLPILEKTKISNLILTPEYSRFDLEFDEHRLPNIEIPLAGKHQVKNAALAICSALKLPAHYVNISHAAIYHGIRQAYWPGRLQLIKKNPRVLIDVAHNADGISALVSNLRAIYNFDNLICLFGVMKNKNYKMMLKTLSTITNLLITVTPEYKRSLPAEELSGAARPFFDRVETIPEISKAFEYALSIASAKDLICVVGSHFVVGELIKPGNLKKFDLT